MRSFAYFFAIFLLTQCAPGGVSSGGGGASDGGGATGGAPVSSNGAAADSGTASSGAAMQVATADSGEPPPVIRSYVCADQWFNGGKIQAASDSDIMILEFSGSNSRPGKLHRMSRATGAVTRDINTQVPLGGTGFVRTTDGRYFVSGSDFFNVQIHQIDSATGATLGAHYNGGPQSYATVIGIDRAGRSYLFVNGGVMRASQGVSQGPVFQNVGFAPQLMAFSPDESRIYLAGGTNIGYASGEGGAFHPLEIPQGATVTHMVSDADGNIFAALLLGGDPFECRMGLGLCPTAIAGYHPQDDRPYQILNTGNGAIRAMAFDFNAGELVIVSSVDRNLGTYHCDDSRNVVVVRSQGNGNVLLADAEGGASQGGGAGGAGAGGGAGGSAGGDGAGGQCPAQIQCGPGTELVNTRCLPTISVSCDAMWGFCMDACDHIEVPRLGWGPCTRACYASKDYCEDHFRAPQ